MRSAVLVTVVACAGGIAFWAQAAELDRAIASRAYWMGWAMVCWGEGNQGARAMKEY